MDTLTLSHSTIRGFVSGNAVNCNVRSSPAGLKLAAGRYLLGPAEDNPVYGLVIAIQPMRPEGQGPVAVKMPTMPKVVPSGTTTREGSTAIVLSSRAIAGNSLVVTAGFDELVSALQHTRGVTLIVT